MDNEDTTSRPLEREDVFSEDAAVRASRPVEETDLEESGDDEHIQVVIDNFPLELDKDQRMAAQKFIGDRAGLFSSRITISGGRTWFNM